MTNGKVCATKGARAFYKALHGADVVIHAPGGPSIGDIYLAQEKTKLSRLQAVKASGVPYVFFAPSMGPFKNEARNPIRKEILEGASLICLREDVSKEMLEEFIPGIQATVTLDSAFQHDIDMIENKYKLDHYDQLKEFIGSGENVIGITVTDLQWNTLYRNDGTTEKRIREAFSRFILYLTQSGYKVLFIPQLFDDGNDFEYMSSFAINNCFVMSDQYDCYFQQYIISRLKAVVGMRYHSNIFSAKMGTPFISVSYEQKMFGFMRKAGLLSYCLKIQDLSFEELKKKFDSLMCNYNEYKDFLNQKKGEFKKQSYRTTELVIELLDKK